MKKLLAFVIILILICENTLAQPKQYFIRVNLKEKLTGTERTAFYKQHIRIPVSYTIYNKENPARVKQINLDANNYFSIVIEDFYIENDDYITIGIDLLKKGPPYFFSCRGNMLHPIWAEAPDTIWINSKRADELQFDKNKNIYFNKKGYTIECLPLSEAAEYFQKPKIGGEKLSLVKKQLPTISDDRFDKFLQYLLNNNYFNQNNLASIFNVGLYMADRANKVSGPDSSLNVMKNINDKINVADLAIVNQKAFFKDVMHYLYLANNFNKNMTYQAKIAFDDVIVDSINANPNQKDFFLEIADAYYNSDLIKKDKSKFPVEKTGKENLQIQFCLIGKAIGKKINCAH